VFERGAGAAGFGGLSGGFGFSFHGLKGEKVAQRAQRRGHTESTEKIFRFAVRVCRGLVLWRLGE
jgi:hypothetical protein